MTGRSPARLLAPIALVTTALALLIILAGGGGGSEDDPGVREGVESPPATVTEAPEKDGGDGRRRTYTVKPGDTPSDIAEKVGIPLEELLDLNPEVDPQTLNPGEKLRLR